MPSKTGFWNQKEADEGHVFSYRLAQWIADYLPKEEMVQDFGCGKGAYLRYLKDRGFEHIIGVEGEKLKDFEVKEIVVKDLTEPNLDLYTIGNALFLEVAEHIEGKYSGTMLDNVARHIMPGGKLIMSWAIPGQGGYHHVNCRDNIYVVEEMKKRGFTLLFDDTMNARQVIESYCSWFRNTLLIFQNQ